MYCNRAVCGFFEKDGKVLVVTRRHSDSYGLIGGKVDPGETEEVALIRELKEEANLSVDKFFPLYTGICGPGGDGKAYVTTTYFLYGEVDIESIKQTEDGIVPLWIEIDELVKNLDLNPFRDYNIKAVEAFRELINNKHIFQ